MAFNKDEIDKLLADCGRMCCICRQRHQIQVHHIKPLHEGGTDDMCPFG